MRPLEVLRLEQAALEAENDALRARAQKAGYLDLSATDVAKVDAALGATDGFVASKVPVGTLQREQQALLAGLRLGERLLALREDNEKLFQHAQHLYMENTAMREENDVLRAGQADGQAQSEIQQYGGANPQSPPPGTPADEKREKRERKEILASMLRDVIFGAPREAVGSETDRAFATPGLPSSPSRPANNMAFATAGTAFAEAAGLTSPSAPSRPDKHVAFAEAGTAFAEGAGLRAAAPDRVSTTQQQVAPATTGAKPRPSEELVYAQELRIREMLRGLDIRTHMR